MTLERRCARSLGSRICRAISAEAYERVGESGLGVHGDMACEVVEDIRFGEVIEAVWPADGDGSGELAAAEAIEEQVRGDVSADGFGLEAGQRP